MLSSRAGSASDCQLHSELLANDMELLAGSYKILFAAPEAIICVSRWRDVLLNPPYCNSVVAVVVDEAHCVSKW